MLNICVCNEFFVKYKFILFLICRCEDRKCCSDWRLNWNLVFPDRFFPPPKMIEKSFKGPQIPSPPSEPVRNATWMSLSENLALQTMTIPGMC